MDQFREANAMVARVEQSTDYYCGAASSVMTFGYFKNSVLQADAYTAIRAHMKEPNDWYSDPAGIAGCLNNMPPQGVIPFVVSDFASNKFSDVINKMFYTIFYLKAPCITLIYGGAHWVVVDGVRYAENASAERSFLGVYITDPYKGDPERRYVPIDPFQSAYLIPDKFGAMWKQNMVIISDNSNTSSSLQPGVSAMWKANMLIISDNSNTSSSLQPGVSATSSGVGGGGAAKSAENIAIAGLSAQGFSGVNVVHGGGGPQSGPIEVTSLVDGAKFSLTFLDARANPEFNNFICAAVDVETGSVLEVASDISSIHILDDQAAQRLVGERYPGQAVIVEPGQFWQLTPKTRSRFSLVREVSVDGKQSFLLPDGEVVKRLPSFGKGG